MRIFLIIALFMSMFTTVNPSCADQFRIGPGDVLEISVWKDQDLSREVIVPPDNIISFPLIGDIDAKNMSVTELRKIIKTKLSDYLPDASVNVMLKEINSMRAYVIGKVIKPGMFGIMMDTSVMQLLSMANGLNPFASERDIHILRSKDGKINKIQFDYKEVLKGQNLEQNIIIKSGDVVVVP